MWATETAMALHRARLTDLVPTRQRVREQGASPSRPARQVALQARVVAAR